MPITTVSDARAVSAATLTSVDGVRLLHWPADDARARRRSPTQADAVHPPRRARAAPPEQWDDLEDWVRLPARPRRAPAARPHPAPARPRRPNGRGSTTTACCASATSGSICRRARVRSWRCSWAVSARWSTPTSSRRRTWRPAGAPRQSARKTMIVRVRQRLGELGLELHNVRDSGYLLDWVDEEGATLPSATCAAS